MPTTEERFNNAVTAAQGTVSVTLNVMTCCNGCTVPSDLGLTEENLETTPHAWHFGGQGNQLVWDGGRPRFMNELDDFDDDEDNDGYVGRKGFPTRPADELYFNHGGPDLLAAQVVADAFRAQGFTVDWSGNEYDCVTVHL